MQVQSFRKFHGMPYATTMCTGNLRSGTDHLVKYFQTKDPSRREKSLHYYSIILFFILGAAIGAVGTKLWGSPALVICCVLLAIAFAMLFVKPKTE